MTKNLDVLENEGIQFLPMLSKEVLYGFGTVELSEMILSLERAISYTEGNRFLLLCFGSEESSHKAKIVTKSLEDYLDLVKEVYRFKVSEKRKREIFLKDGPDKGVNQ